MLMAERGPNLRAVVVFSGADYLRALASVMFDRM